MKKRHIFLFLALFGIIGACNEDFLNIKPKGSLDQGVLATDKGIEALLIGSYAMLDGNPGAWGWGTAASNWVYGDIRGMVANKGTDANDQPPINPLQSFTETATNEYIGNKWRQVYDAISRCNSTIMVINEALGSGSITQEQADLFMKQARALRGWYHFEAWRLFKMIPYMDETTDPATVTNTEDVRARILADLQEGLTLPQDMGAVGKFNKTVCQVLVAKALMQMNNDYAGALTLLQDVKTNGKKPNGAAIGLAATYPEIFDIPNRNGIEAVYTVQYSVNDGSGGANGGYGEVLNFPYKGGGGSPGGCCGFFQGTQEMVNSFRTVDGLPLLDNSYNLDPVKNDQGLVPTDPFTPDAGELDPRLDWTIGRRGIPFWDWGPVTGSDWIRDQSYAGPWTSTKKQVYKKSQEGTYTEVGNWTSGYTANGYRMIRYADVLLLLAECQIETNDLDGAFANINLIRARAANPAGFVRTVDGTADAANYVIEEYPAAGAYPFDNQANARLALRMERKLELAMEGHRWFDLNRWGITVSELNRVLTYEKTTAWGARSMYAGAEITEDDMTFPVPQRQIDLSNGILQQNR